MRLSLEQIEARLQALWEAHGHLDIWDADTPLEKTQGNEVMKMLYKEILRWEDRLARLKRKQSDVS